ncbi:Protein disulfide-isomerase 5-3 [Bienertia sinuspersici]
MKPSWEKTAMIVRERHDPEADGRILLGKVDCTEQVDLCRRHHVQGYPSIRVFRKGSDVKSDHGHHEHESYYGDRDTDSLVKFMESLVSPIPLANQQALALDDKSGNKTRNIKRPAPSSSGCRIEGFVRVKKVPGNLIVSAHSGSHSFDASKMNMSHVVTHLSFGKRISPRVIKDVKRIIPYLGESHDRLSGRSYITQDEASDGNVTGLEGQTSFFQLFPGLSCTLIEHYLQVVKTEVRASNEHTLVEEYEYTAHSSLVQSPNVL